MPPGGLELAASELQLRADDVHTFGPEAAGHAQGLVEQLLGAVPAAQAQDASAALAAMTRPLLRS